MAGRTSATTASGGTSSLAGHTVLTESVELSHEAARDAIEHLDVDGFVCIRGLLDESTIRLGKALVTATLDDPERQSGEFASQTDIRYGRRDFLAVPLTEHSARLAGLLATQLEPVMRHYCADTSQVLEMSTLTSYRYCSHQYFHRDPAGVLCLFLAVEPASRAQGTTVFVPGTHLSSDTAALRRRFGDHATFYSDLLQRRINSTVFARNIWTVLSLLWASRLCAVREVKDRLLSTTADAHQPNLTLAVTDRNPFFSVRSLHPRLLARLVKYRNELRVPRPVSGDLEPGDLLVYRSDVLHAGPDNRTDLPRRFFNLNIACDDEFQDEWAQGYTPHSTLREAPVALGDLLATPKR